MSKVKIQGNASGTGVLTLTAPNTSTDRTITLPDSTGTLATTADTGVAGITSSADATAITIDSSEKVNIGETGTPYPSNSRFHVKELTGGNYVASFRHDGNSDDSMGIAIVTGKNTGSSGVVAAQFKDGDGNDVGKIYHTGTGLFYNTGATGGIEFTNGGADNTLDDYEEGTWTPNVGGNAVYNSQVGKYTKVGNMVTVWLNMNINTLGTGANNFVYGLPFAVSNTSEFNVAGNSLSYFNACNATVTYVGLYIVRNTANMKFITIGASGGSSAVEGTNFLKSSADIYCTITYKTG
jgi:hypothetical protein